ncbi:MAG: pyruvate kinase [Candidatus Wallbacteria bacterium]
MFNLTKIICTIGPSSNSPEMLKKLIDAGMDVARLNFSHGAHETHLENINKIRKVSKETGKYIAILADLQGPKIRVAKLPDGPLELKNEALVTITTREETFGPDIIPTVYKGLPKDVKPGSVILLDDGLLELSVVEVVSETDVKCRVVKGGLLKEKKGINLPNVKVSAPSVTEKDREDLEFILKNDVDYIALSFVRHASDIEEVKGIIHGHKLTLPVIAKIERPEAVTNFDSILKAADGIMVARGDMGIEVSPEKVPQIQKNIISKCNYEGKPVIVATQMLESMIENPRPTRAEASDVANAIIDGTDAIMLSGETASGKYPHEAVLMMSKISAEMEEFISKNQKIGSEHKMNPLFMVADGVCHATTQTAKDLNAKMIVTYTESGSTALLVSKYRPKMPILAVTMSEKIARRMNLYWGVLPYVIEKVNSTDQMLISTNSAALKTGLVKNGDFIVISGGIPIGKAGTTNLMKVSRIFEPSAVSVESNNGIMVYNDEARNVKITLDLSKCTGCGLCVTSCAFKIFGYQNNKTFVNSDNLKKCMKDGLCIEKCPSGVIKIE